MEEKLPTLDEMKKQAVIDRLTLLDGHRVLAAASLGITGRTIYNLINHYNIKIPSHRGPKAKLRKHPHWDAKPSEIPETRVTDLPGGR